MGKIESRAEAESIDPWIRLHAALENNNTNQPSAHEKAIESPAPAIGNTTPLLAPAVPIGKALKEQLPNLNYRDPGFIKKFEEACGKVDKAASIAAGEFGIILEEYKAAVKSVAGIQESEPSVLAEESAKV